MLDADFKLLIQNAHVLEDEFIKLLKNEGDNVIIPSRTTPFSDYDFIINDVKYEIKLDNKVSIAEHAKQRVICNCGITSSKHHISSHLRTNIHTININNLYLNELNYYNF